MIVRVGLIVKQMYNWSNSAPLFNTWTNSKQKQIKLHNTHEGETNRKFGRERGNARPHDLSHPSLLRGSCTDCLCEHAFACVQASAYSRWTGFSCPRWPAVCGVASVRTLPPKSHLCSGTSIFPFLIWYIYICRACFTVIYNQQSKCVF